MSENKIEDFINKIEQLNNIAQQRQFDLFTWHLAIHETMSDLIKMYQQKTQEEQEKEKREQEEKWQETLSVLYKSD